MHLIRGDDPILIGDAVRSTVAELVGDGDASLMVEELDEERLRVDEGYQISPLVDAAQTPPFLTDRRVVVGRHLARFSKADDVALLIGYLAEPLPSTDLVLVWERGQNPRQDRMSAPPKSLLGAVSGAGGRVVEADIPAQAAAAARWLDDRLDGAEVDLAPAARRRIAATLGEDRSRVLGLIEVLESTYGPGARVDVADVEPFLGDRGSVPPWELTDALADGDIPKALDALQRLLGAGDRHPLQVLATLHTQYSRLLRLADSGIADEATAAQALGMKGSTFPAKKLLSLSRRTGSSGAAQAIRLLAQADLDLRGEKEWPDALVLEVLVARLANLSRR